MTINLKNLKKSVLQGSAWTIFGFGAGQVLRFGKSLILTRLLFPEAYGVMAIVWSVLYVLGMLSDAGLSAAAIRHPKGDQSDFLNTLWTAKVIRGAIIFLVTCSIAYPISEFYKMPDLLWLIPASGLTMLIGGFNSTNVYLLQRQMRYKDTSIITLGWAYFYPSMASLIGGSIIGSIYYMICTHIFLPGIKNRLQWDSVAFKDIFHFGKWILFSSAIYIVYAQGDRFILGKYLDAKLLGVYSIAVMLSEVVSSVISKLNTGVFYAALSQVINSERHRLKSTFYKIRLGIDFGLIIPIAVLMIISEDVVRLLYDARYHAAGWMLQILCFRLLMIAMLSSSESCLFSLGKPQYAVIQNIFRAGWILIGVPFAWHAYGMIGVVWVIATTELPVLMLLWFGMAQEELLSLTYELRSVVFALIGLIVGYSLRELIFLVIP
jgi:O-antigen/teichoic acid export membrane protein